MFLQLLSDLGPIYWTWHNSCRLQSFNTYRVTTTSWKSIGGCSFSLNENDLGIVNLKTFFPNFCHLIHNATMALTNHIFLSLTVYTCIVILLPMITNTILLDESQADSLMVSKKTLLPVVTCIYVNLSKLHNCIFLEKWLIQFPTTTMHCPFATCLYPPPTSSVRIHNGTWYCTLKLQYRSFTYILYSQGLLERKSFLVVLDTVQYSTVQYTVQFWREGEFLLCCTVQ